MRVLVIGSGAREHALLRPCGEILASTGLIVAPGNAGTAAIARTASRRHHVGEAVAKLAADTAADLVVIGPEVPLVLGVADAVRAAGIACFGPSAAAARIEGSKAFAKDVMAAAGVSHGAQRDRRQSRASRCGVATASVPEHTEDKAWVVKDDGLAAGKGVVVTADRDVARARTPPRCSTLATRCCWSRFSTAPRCRCCASSTARQ